MSTLPDDRTEAAARLQELCSRLPKGIGAWSWDRTVDFKKTMHAARGVLNRRKANVQALRSAITAIEAFHA